MATSATVHISNGREIWVTTSKPTPADVNVKLEKDDEFSKAVDPIRYQSMVLYAANATRPDIAQAVGPVSKFNIRPNESHLTAVKRIFRYLKGTEGDPAKRTVELLQKTGRASYRKNRKHVCSVSYLSYSKQTAITHVQIDTSPTQRIILESVCACAFAAMF